ncbi:MAG: hypothetical protein HZA25_01550 [Candidatus Niyogibacteria bacterium]|nr:hypothetical protein [Candidatus Niyogibacteria bacterium]
MPRTQTYIAMFVGSTLGGMIPMLWGAGVFSFSSIIFSAIGALLGVYVAFRLR